MAFFKSVFDKVLGKPETDTAAAQPHQQPAGSRNYAEPDFRQAASGMIASIPDFLVESRRAVQ